MAERALELVLPWPSKDLSPNARVHWRARSKATKVARRTAVMLAFEAGWKSTQLPEGRLHLWIDFYQTPKKVLPDDDNLLLRFKAYRDRRDPARPGGRRCRIPLAGCLPFPWWWVR
ncbi:hypothetical protein [Stenotrophomonas sp. Marseille-Q5258]|uniref:hypothetical protein n=1 Tax=Stenotrophomonas sp. Marseille-Q5258 TaxID=2972779 RepID=UPI0021C5BA4E|nr:hypothetical protein [Stenotrophomonas sp. Marseille-Q5258]